MRILVVSPRPPWPSRRGDQARAAAWVGGLGRRHQVALVSLCPPGFAGRPPPAELRWRSVAAGRSAVMALGSIPRLPVQVALHVSRRLQLAVAEEVRAFRPDVAVLMLSRLGWLLPQLRDLPVVVDLVDSLALNMRRRASYQPLASLLWRWEGRRMAAWDRRVIAGSHRATVVCQRDRRALLAAGTEADKVEVVPFGVEVPERLPSRGPEGRVVILSGNLGYFPTVEGARWLLNEVWPEVRRRRDDCELWLAGARPGRALRRWAQRAGARLWDEPEDLAAVRARASVAVAPLRAGSGTPIKVLESMAEGLPVVATPEAVAGLDGLPEGAVAVAAEPGGFAERIVRLLERPEESARQAGEGFRFVRSGHELASVTRRFETVLSGAADVGTAT